MILMLEFCLIHSYVSQLVYVKDAELLISGSGVNIHLYTEFEILM